MKKTPDKNGTRPDISRSLRRAGVLIIAGLIVEGLTLVWNHPLSFLGFLSIGGLLVGLGILVFLLALVSSGNTTEEEKQSAAEKR